MNFNIINCFKNNRKKTIIILSSAISGIAMITAFLLIFVFNIICFHEWKDATCTSPKTCIKCSQTSGEMLEHGWSAATCETPEICSVCGEIRAEALGHNWAKADCENPKTCKNCKKTDGEPLGHSWEKATCQKPKTCSVCKKTDGNAADHDWKAATCETPKTCKTCGKTEGTAKGHNWLEATYTSPETCSYCGETRGDVLKVEFTGNWHMNGGAPTDTMEITQNGNEYSITIQSVNTSNGTMLKDYYTAYADGNYLYCQGNCVSSMYIYDSSMGGYEKAASERRPSYDYCYIENGTLYWNGNTAYSMY